jgi:hypothetical protein
MQLNTNTMKKLLIYDHAILMLAYSEGYGEKVTHDYTEILLKDATETTKQLLELI